MGAPGKSAAIRRIERRSLWILALLVGISVVFFPISVACGVGLGGAMSIASFQMLQIILQNALLGPACQAKLKLVLYHYLRLGVLFALLAAVIAFHLVDPVALVVGLSVVVLSLLLAAVFDLRKIRLEV